VFIIGRTTKIFTSSVGRRCCAAQEFRAERQLCPTRKMKILVLRPHHPSHPLANPSAPSLKRDSLFQETGQETGQSRIIAYFRDVYFKRRVSISSARDERRVIPETGQSRIIAYFRFLPALLRPFAQEPVPVKLNRLAGAEAAGLTATANAASNYGGASINFGRRSIQNPALQKSLAVQSSAPGGLAQAKAEIGNREIRPPTSSLRPPPRIPPSLFHPLTNELWPGVKCHLDVRHHRNRHRRWFEFRC
jgi:hypothetical protein